MANIKSITAREILNSKGNPTIEATVVLDDGSRGIAACPSGTSAGSHEAIELRDNDMSHFAGLGVIKAMTNIEKIIAPELINKEPYNQDSIDKVIIALDGTENKSHLGANATLSVSMAIAKAAAISAQKPLYMHLHEQYPGTNSKLKMPTPIFNVLNGGLHGSGSLDFQEFILVPKQTQTYTESLAMGFSIYHSLKQLLKQNKYSTLVGDEGGFEPHLTSNYNALDFLVQAIDASGYNFGKDVFVGLDAAANSFFKDQAYHIRDKQKPLSAEELIAYYKDLSGEFHMKYLEDLLCEDDWEDWSLATAQLGNTSMIVGDDLTVTNPKRLQVAIDKKAMNAILIKPNQIGTVSEAIQVTNMAQQAGFKTIVSHRSGETNDDFIADFGVAVTADYVKFGAPARGERVAKYNRLLQIESELKITT
ncbi:MAG TPA: phosphopyruvate hydratase [Candidatus Saccharimonadales bacterium]|nr:phosphopyruvate hydratase [Candidatus Saccharimonadales bacterium]